MIITCMHWGTGLAKCKCCYNKCFLQVSTWDVHSEHQATTSTKGQGWDCPQKPCREETSSGLAGLGWSPLPSFPPMTITQTLNFQALPLIDVMLAIAVAHWRKRHRFDSYLCQEVEVTSIGQKTRWQPEGPSSYWNQSPEKSRDTHDLHHCLKHPVLIRMSCWYCLAP